MFTKRELEIIKNAIQSLKTCFTREEEIILEKIESIKNKD